MRGKSHLSLGEYLVVNYMHHIPRHCIYAFLIGCIQPDRNPATYLKGSVHHQWMRGHNYRNAKKFMVKIASRLENRKHFTVIDYYTLGKLIHYTADAFTLPHNSHFPDDLMLHREYEAKLQKHFLSFLRTNPQINVRETQTLAEIIFLHHKEYSRQQPGIHTDTIFTLSACCSVLSIISAKQFPVKTECSYVTNSDFLSGSYDCSSSPDSPFLGSERS